MRHTLLELEKHLLYLRIRAGPLTISAHRVG
jgi:hypothetical protein